MVDRSRTKSPRGNRGPTPTDTDHLDNDPTRPADPDPDADTLVAVAHWHGHTADLHIRGDAPHWMRDDGHPEWDTWDPPDTLPYEYLGDRPMAHPDTHRHQGTATGNHEGGQQRHRHAPVGDDDGSANRVIPLPDPDMPTYAPAEVEASQARHPSGREPADEVLPSYAAEIERQLAETRAAHDRLDAIPQPTPPATPVPEGVSRPGTSIAHPGALNLLNSIHGVTDDALNHEMTWQQILVPLVVEASTYHADQRADGGHGPELAPIELWMHVRDALEHVIQPRLTREREARP